MAGGVSFNKIQHHAMSKKPKTPEFWPGTDIVKSTNNGFTLKPREMTPAEKGAMTSRQNAAKGHATQRKLGVGFGAATMGGLSKRAEAQLKNVGKSIRVSKKVTQARVDSHRKLVRTAI
jgi:hypothetical protein